VNEAGSYHDFMQALIRTVGAGEALTAFLVCDHRALRRYGLGFAKPFPIPVGPYLRSGYLQRGQTLTALAVAAGIDAAGLVTTVAEYNVHAREGRDPAFGRGGTPFERFGGDPARQPNPCVAPLDRAPFYAVRLRPGSLGTFAGLKTDRHARVLGKDRMPIEGLYAVGNDMASIMGGHYPSGGITLGPAMTFGYLAGRHLANASEAVDTSAAPARVATRGGDRHVALPAEDQFA
jgi:succinate dehydrogenase/fumarate reductase flavoprotein subunit